MAAAVWFEVIVAACFFIGGYYTNNYVRKIRKQRKHKHKGGSHRSGSKHRHGHKGHSHTTTTAKDAQQPLPEAMKAMNVKHKQLPKDLQEQLQKDLKQILQTAKSSSGQGV